MGYSGEYFTWICDNVYSAVAGCLGTLVLFKLWQLINESNGLGHGVQIFGKKLYWMFWQKCFFFKWDYHLNMKILTKAD